MTNEVIFLLIEFCAIECTFESNSFIHFCAFILGSIQSGHFISFSDIVFLTQQFIQNAAEFSCDLHQKQIKDALLFFWNLTKTSVYPNLTSSEISDHNLQNFLNILQLKPFMVINQPKLYQKQHKLLLENIKCLESSENAKSKLDADKRNTKNKEPNLSVSEAEEGEIKENPEESEVILVMLPSEQTIYKISNSINELEKEIKLRMSTFDAQKVDDIVQRCLETNIDDLLLTNLILPRILSSYEDSLLFSTIFKQKFIRISSNFDDYLDKLFEFARKMLMTLTALTERETEKFSSFIYHLILLYSVDEDEIKTEQRFRKLKKRALKNQNTRELENVKKDEIEHENGKITEKKTSVLFEKNGNDETTHDQVMKNNSNLSVKIDLTKIEIRQVSENDNQEFSKNAILCSVVHDELQYDLGIVEDNASNNKMKKELLTLIQDDLVFLYKNTKHKSIGFTNPENDNLNQQDDPTCISNKNDPQNNLQLIQKKSSVNLQNPEFKIENESEAISKIQEIDIQKINCLQQKLGQNETEVKPNEDFQKEEKELIPTEIKSSQSKCDSPISKQPTDLNKVSGEWKLNREKYEQHLQKFEILCISIFNIENFYTKNNIILM